LDGYGFLDLLLFSLKAGASGKKRLILRFGDSALYRQILRILQEAKRRSGLLRDVRQLTLIRGISCYAAPDAFTRKWSSIIRMEEDSSVKIHALSRSAAALEDGIPWGVRHIQAPEAWSITTGHNVRVGVIDTGVDNSHPDLQNSVSRGINLIYRSVPPHDDNGHGTHIAGTIAAANRLHGMIGVAPRATIHPVKAFDQNGTAFVSDIILGLDWCVRNRMHIVNMSFGMQNRSKSLQQAVQSAIRAGVAVVASSGNDGRSSEIDYPARYGQTIAVGAINKQGRVASFTNRSSLIDIYAPGDKIVSAWIGGKYREMSGTSMATSHVSGAIALLIAYKPGLTHEQIKELLQTSGKPLKSSKAPHQVGELNVLRLLSAADKLY